MARSADSVADRQRDRAQRGIGSKKPSALGSDRPSPPRRRRPALAALAVLLIVGGAALAGLLALRLDSREPVLVVSSDVAAGTEITRDVLSTSNVASSGLQLVPESQIGEVLGTYASGPLAQGELLQTSQLTTAPPFANDRAQIGVGLQAGRAPAGLRSGDLVRLVRIGDGNTAPTPIATALVLSTSTNTSGGSLGSDGQESRTATLMVPALSADGTVDAAANERLGIALVERGVSVQDAQLATLGGGSSR